MLELGSQRKPKVQLPDYDFREDIACRILMSDFSTFDLELLEELLYSPLKISAKKLAKSLNIEMEPLLRSLEKLAKVHLLTIQDDQITVDKERRKYFEFQINRFDPEFKPDMEFIQKLLKEVPIHLLPNWYSIPRTSNNIFDSIVEKYLLTPHIFQRYLSELSFTDPILAGIIKDLFQSKGFKIASSDLIAKYNLSREGFEEKILTLEFNFVCFVSYEKDEDHWAEYVVPFHEWQEYLEFVQATESPQIPESDPIEQKSSSPFALIDEMSKILRSAKKKPLADSETNPLIEKLLLVDLLEKADGKLVAAEGATAWLALSLEDRAMFLYRHNHNRLLSQPASERQVREAEKAVKRVLHGGWVYLDDFVKGSLVPLSEHSVVALKKIGKHWRYVLPHYSEEEIAILKATITEWLYEKGMVNIGTCRGRTCFALTPFGRFFFND